jgi:hypothetical protein
MQDKRQYFPTAVSFPGTAATFKVVSASEITTTVPGVANQGHRDGDDLGQDEAQQQRGVPFSVETGSVETGAVETDAIEISAGEIKDVRARPGRLLAPSFGLFLRAALLAHLRRTFR